MPTMGSPSPNSSVPRLPLSFDISSGKHMQALLFGPITEVILEGTTSNHSCLLTQGPSDHPGAGLGSHLEERALVLVVQFGQLSWLLSDQRGSPHCGAKRLTVDRQGISGCRVPPPTPAMWHRYLLPWGGSDLSVGEHFWRSLHRDSLCLCKHVRVCVCVCTRVCTKQWEWKIKTTWTPSKGTSLYECLKTHDAERHQTTEMNFTAILSS